MCHGQQHGRRRSDHRDLEHMSGAQVHPCVYDRVDGEMLYAGGSGIEAFKFSVELLQHT